MTRITTLAKRLLNSDIKKLIKAGILDKDLSLTAGRGRAAIDAVLVQANMEALLEIADERIEEDKEEKDCDK